MSLHCGGGLDVDEVLVVVDIVAEYNKDMVT